MPVPYNRKSWSRATKLTLRMVCIDRSHMGDYRDQDGKPWSQKQIESLVKQGRMKVVQNRLKRNKAGVVIGRTLTVRVRPTVRQRKVAA